MEPPLKRRRLSNDDGADDTNNDPLPRSLSAPISPPARRRPPLGPATEAERTEDTVTASSPKPSDDEETRQTYRSPFQLTWIRDLPEAANADAVTLRDLLGDPLIAECWDFNYLHDIDFLIEAFDEDVRQSVEIHVVHGFWKQEDESRLMLQVSLTGLADLVTRTIVDIYTPPRQKQASAYKNVFLHCAFMPEMFGTHHSKMLVLLRHDDTAQVVIHTANMISRDWTNMTQAVWRSPLLPLKTPQDLARTGSSPALGRGEKFKVDLLNYLRAYDQRRITCRSLVQKLERYDFSTIKAVLIASVPGRHDIHDETEETKWGWPAMKRALRSIPVQEGKSEIVVQISSIATLGPKDTWLRESLFDSLAASQNKPRESPSFKVVFPTPDEIRRSLDGYGCGASIHTKIQSAQQAKQLLYLKPMFCHWANDAERGQALPSGSVTQEAGRKRAAPHIKTYIRYGQRSIDWALTTSANLSKQAWGEAVNSSGEVRIASWEIGVLVWPSLFAENAKMIGTFQKDTPTRDEADETPVVGLRIPYNLPLQPYGAEEKPWVATASHTEPDWKGQAWVV